MSELHIGLKGTMGALFLKDLGKKTRRGQIGRVAKGRILGGISYGYRRVTKLGTDGEPERGLREIDEEQAQVVRRIFREFPAGRSPRAIAKALNEEGVPSPSGREWRANTINGNRERGNGILHNELYTGVISYNRQSFVRDPATRKRVARPNPRSQWVTTAVRELAIIDQQTWEHTVARFGDSVGLPPERQRRPKRLLSGLVRCGTCNGSFTIIGRDSWGCSAHQQTGTCSNNRSITNDILDRRVLGALRERMLQPQPVAAYIEAYQQTLQEDRHRKAKERRALEKRAAKADRRVTRLTLALADGGKTFGDIRELLTNQVAERERCRRELADLDAEPTLVLMPNLADRYRRSIDQLAQALAGDEIEVQQAREALRGLLDSVVATLAPMGRGVALEVRGHFAAMVDIANDAPPWRAAYHV